MLLVPQRLRGRSFHIQFVEILQEFGDVIPWLDPLKNLRYVTNATHFRDVLLKGLKCNDPSDITPLQLLTSDRGNEYIGGIVHFTHSPEHFRDSRNQGIQEQLVSQGCQFISCLQIRGVMRGRGYGQQLMQRSLRSILTTYPKIWGVASDPNLLPWYQSFGGTVLSPLENKDDLWIIVWE